MKTYRCAGPSCPGLPYKASDLYHPATCARPKPKHYTVLLADCAGPWGEWKFETFVESLAFYAWIKTAARRVNKTTVLYNADRVDLGCADGLTEDEREQFEDVA